MWIRSQNGESLRKYDGVTINFYNKKQILGEPNFYRPDGEVVEGYILGNYETEERAMEILNQIHKHLEMIKRVELDEKVYSDGNFVFHMP